MAELKVRVLGSGDAFGSGGRFNTCFAVESRGYRFLIDCGASSLVALKRFGVDPASVDCVVVTHLHGDHYGGIPFLFVDGLASGREEPLTILGPPGIRENLEVLTEAMFPGSARPRSPFPLEVLEYQAMWPTPLGALTVTAFPVTHVPATRPHALRIEFGGKVIAYSGDTAWNTHLVEAAAGADLFVCEAYTREPESRIHLDLATLRKNRRKIDCRRILLTHMGDDVLNALPLEDFEWAEDGMIVEL